MGLFTGLLQIIPTDRAWLAAYKGDDGKAYTAPLVGWGLFRSDGGETTEVHGLVVDDNKYITDAPSVSFLGYCPEDDWNDGYWNELAQEAE